MKALEHLVAEFGTQRRCATISWGVVRDGELVLDGGFVHPDAEHTIAASNVVTGADTTYRIASMTKSFSSAAALLLRDDGAIRLDDRLTDWAPELVAVAPSTADAEAITIRHLLTMSAGLVTDDPWADRNLDLSPHRFDEIVRKPLVFAIPTGAGYEYSNFGFALLGRVIERATGTPIRDHVDTRLIQPLGMAASRWDPPSATENTWMRPLRWYTDLGFTEEAPPLADGMIAPMGGIWSTVRDIARWISFLDDAFPARDDPDSSIMARASRREMQTPHTLVRRGTLRGVPHTMSYGMGLRILDEDVDATTSPRRVVNHSGGFPGYGSNMRWLPGTGLGVVALSNTTYAPMTELTARMLDIVTDTWGTPPPRQPKASHTHRLNGLAEDLVALLNRSGDDADAWDDATTARVFADNVEADLEYARRQLAAASVAPLELQQTSVDNDGHLRLICHSTKQLADGTPAVEGPVVINVLIAPPTPLRVQSYSLHYTSAE